MKRFHQFHAEQDAILAKMLPEAELERILRRERKDEVAAWKESVDSIETELQNGKEYFT
jgi:hypothetical protein